MPPLPQLVRQAIRRHGLLKRGDTVLVAFSGGPDSTALLHVLASLARALRIELVAAHLDHAQRSASDEDARYCQRVAKRLGLSVLTARLPAGRRSEEAMREARYAFLLEQAAMIGASAIATGHTLTDRAETLLLNLVRGAGSAGLGSLAPLSVREGIRIVRPLILASRADVLSYLEDGGHRYLEDPGNADPAFDRNRVRREVLPVLESIRAGATAALARAADILAADAAYLDAQAGRALTRRRGAAGTSLRRLPPSLARHVVRTVIREARGDLRGVTLDMVDRILAAAADAARDGRRRHVPLPGPWVAAASAAGIAVVPGRRGRPGQGAPRIHSEVRRGGFGGAL